MALCTAPVRRVLHAVRVYFVIPRFCCFNEDSKTFHIISIRIGVVDSECIACVRTNRITIYGVDRSNMSPSHGPRQGLI